VAGSLEDGTDSLEGCAAPLEDSAAGRGFSALP